MDYEEIRTPHEAGSTAGEIASLLAASDTTYSPVPLGELLFTMNNRGMLVRLIRPVDTGEKWAGSLVNMILYIEANGSDVDKTAVGQFFSHITNDRNSTFDLTDLSFAFPFRTMADSFAGQPGMPSQEDFDAIAALGGGWRYRDVTEAEVAAVISEYETAEATRISEQAIAEATRIQSGYVSIASQAAASSLPGTKAAALAAFTGKLNEVWVD